jgi:protein-L-isoaspartate(D-aspartate) O-methyltransferase
MQAASLARLIQLADIAMSDRVLVVGCGSGYSAAVLARLAATVVALESDPALQAEASRTVADLGIANVDVPFFAYCFLSRKTQLPRVVNLFFID